MLATIEHRSPPPPPGGLLLPVLGWFTATRLAIFAIGFVGAATFVDHHSLAIAGPAALSPEAVWLKWDARWYERIAVHGYAFELDTPMGQAAVAFFPLYPLTVGLLLTLLPFGSFFWVGSAVSAVCTFTACTLAVRELAPQSDEAHRLLFVLLTAAGSFYFTIPYTEGLFLLLVVATMVLTRRRAYLWAAAAAGLGAVTRVHGLALLAVPALACWMDPTLGARARALRLAALAGLFAAPIAVHMTLLAQLQGSPYAYVERQAVWDNPMPYPFRAAVELVLDHPRRVQAYLHGGIWVLYLGLLARYWRRLPLGEALFCLGALVISTQQASFQGIYRYVAVLVPLALGLAHDRAEVRLAVVILNIIFGTIMILAFVTNNRLTV